MSFLPQTIQVLLRQFEDKRRQTQPGPVYFPLLLHGRLSLYWHYLQITLEVVLQLTLADVGPQKNK